MLTGRAFGTFRVIAKLGEGGMGEVYRASDTRLGRDVALKILPDTSAADPDRRARLQREAKTLASLSHPNIASIHGIEEADRIIALVLELVEGPTLAERIEQGPLALDEALEVARQITDGLEAAHEQGVVHRDLKPANIKLRPDGTVKILDFGIAKAVAPESSAATPGNSAEPTITTPAMTGIGVVLGTAAYMSPEQARGKPLDKRSDIWSFGCVLYEMLTGRRAFDGEDTADVLAAILARDWDDMALPPATPEAIRRLIRRCLQKDPRQRLRDIGDARIEIRDAVTNPYQRQSIDGVVASRQHRWMTVGFPIGLAAMIAVVAAIWMTRTAPSAPEARVEITTPPSNVPGSLAISPDGRAIAFVATDKGQTRLWLRPIDSSARVLTGTDGAHNPFWSPDSRSIGFFADGNVKRIDIDSGSVRVLAPVSRGTGGTWSRDGVVLFSTLGEPISKVRDTGGDPESLAGLVKQGSDFTPYFLPDSRHFLYYVRGSADARGVYVGQIDGTSAPTRLVDADAGAVYTAGHLLFVQQGTLFAQSFNARRLELSGDPVPLAAGCACTGLSASDAGSIAFRIVEGTVNRQFVWFDRSGNEVGKVGDSSTMAAPMLSPDGQRVVGYRGNALDGNIDVWLLDLRHGGFNRLTSDVADDVAPVWSPEGDRIAFSSNRGGRHDIFVKSLGAGGREELLLATDQHKTVTDWSADGRFIIFNSRDAKSRSHVWAVPLGGERKPFPVAQTGFEEQWGQLSPDGNWLAYQSNESGRYEIYLQAFPDGAHKSLISTNGGGQSRWRHDGKELFYVALDGRLMAVPIGVTSKDASPEIGTPVVLFVPPLGGTMALGDFRPQYMVSRDGQRFLIATVTQGPSSPITVILNWKPRP